VVPYFSRVIRFARSGVVHAVIRRRAADAHASGKDQYSQDCQNTFHGHSPSGNTCAPVHTTETLFDQSICRFIRQMTISSTSPRRRSIRVTESLPHDHSPAIKRLENTKKPHPCMLPCVTRLSQKIKMKWSP